jgi:hypothetical protein
MVSTPKTKAQAQVQQTKDYIKKITTLNSKHQRVCQLLHRLARQQKNVCQISGRVLDERSFCMQKKCGCIFDICYARAALNNKKNAKCPRCASDCGSTSPLTNAANAADAKAVDFTSLIESIYHRESAGSRTYSYYDQPEKPESTHAELTEFMDA